MKECKLRFVWRFGIRKNMVLEVSPEVRSKLVSEGNFEWVDCIVGRRIIWRHLSDKMCYGFGLMAQ